MKRRGLLAAIGATVGGGVALGTGAFSSAEAERTVTVEIDSDSQAYLSFDDREMEPNGGLSNIVGGTIQFDINDVLDDDLGDGEGPGTQSVYTFNNVFGVENLGDEDVFIEVTFEDTNTLDGVSFYAGTNDDALLNEVDNVAKLPVGEEADMGIFLDSSEEGVKRGEDREIEDITATITASADGNEGADNVVKDITVS